jgi:SAM-dependent methyltransferase
MSDRDPLDSGHLGDGRPGASPDARPAGMPRRPGDVSRHGYFERTYQGETRPPWDTGRPQPAMVRATDAGRVRGRVLDVGCGTGTNALFFAERGCSVIGVDVASTAIAKARAAALERGLDAVFFVGDLTAPGPVALSEEKFDAVTDVGFFHSLSDEERSVWVPRLAGLLAPGGSYVMLCFSDKVPGSWGPRRISEAELRGAFTPEAGFSELIVEPAKLEANAGPGEVDAWLVRAVRAG